MALYVHAHQADALADTQWVGTQDPYVRITLSGTDAVARTAAHVDGDCNPRWDDDLSPKMILDLASASAVAQTDGFLATAARAFADDGARGSEGEAAEAGRAGTQLLVEVWHESAAVDSLIGKTVLNMSTIARLGDDGGGEDALPALPGSGAANVRRRVALEDEGVLELSVFLAPSEWGAARAWSAAEEREERERATVLAAADAAGSSSVEATFASSVPQLRPSHNQPGAAGTGTGNGNGCGGGNSGGATSEGAPEAASAVTTEASDADAAVNAWSAPPLDGLPVRGKSYLVDGVKIPTRSPAFQLVGVDLLRPPAKHSKPKTKRRQRSWTMRRKSKDEAATVPAESASASAVDTVAVAGAGAGAGAGTDGDAEGRTDSTSGNAGASVVDHPNNFVQRRCGAAARALCGAEAAAAARLGFSPDDHYCVINFNIGFANFVSYFSSRRPTPDTGGADAAFDSLASRFFARGPEGDEFRRRRLKILPRVVHGPWVVHKAVGLRPAILGDRIKQTYFHGPNFLEICVDISSSLVAQKLCRLATKFVTKLTMDLAFIVQGESEAELPERVLGCVRFHRLNIASCVEQDSMQSIDTGTLAAAGADSLDIDAFAEEMEAKRAEAEPRPGVEAEAVVEPGAAAAELPASALPPAPPAGAT